VTGRVDRFDAAVRHADQVDRLHLETQVAGHAASDVENVVDDLRLRLGVALDGLDRPRRALVVELPGGQHPRPSEDRRERRPQFV